MRIIFPTTSNYNMAKIFIEAPDGDALIFETDMVTMWPPTGRGLPIIPTPLPEDLKVIIKVPAFTASKELFDLIQVQMQKIIKHL